MKQTELLKKLNLSAYVALDFETTGLDSDFDRIIEVAAILFKDGKPKKKVLYTRESRKKYFTFYYKHYRYIQFDGQQCSKGI